MAKKVNKPNETNNIVSLKKGNDVVLTEKGDSRNILSSFYFTEISDSKSIKKFIKNIESQIRSSKEYKEYIYHLNTEIGIHSCAIFGGLRDEDEISLEFHHYPFTLYDIVEIVINDKIISKEDFTSFDVISEVLELHQKNQVGLVKLCKTAHELVHDGKVFVKLESVFGKVNDFVDTYIENNAIPEDLIIKYNNLIDMNEMNFKDYVLYLQEKNPDLEIEIDEINEEINLIEMNNEEFSLEE